MADTKTILYIHKGCFPEEVRAEKLCKSLAKSGHKVILVCKWFKENKQQEEIDTNLVQNTKAKLKFAQANNDVNKDYRALLTIQTIHFFKNIFLI